MSVWKPADQAPLNVKVNARFERDGETIERAMTRTLPNLWWDWRIYQYAQVNPTQFAELEPA